MQRAAAARHERAPWRVRATLAAQDAFFEADGLGCCTSLVAALAAAFDPDGTTAAGGQPAPDAPAVHVAIECTEGGAARCRLLLRDAGPGRPEVSPTEEIGPPTDEIMVEQRQADAPELTRAVFGCMRAAVRAHPVLGARCWHELAGADGLTSVLRHVAAARSAHAADVVGALVEYGTGPPIHAEPDAAPEQPVAAAAALRLIPLLRSDRAARDLLRRLREAAARSEAAAAALARGGLLGAALGWLLGDHAGAPTIELNFTHANYIPNPV